MLSEERKKVEEDKEDRRTKNGEETRIQQKERRIEKRIERRIERRIEENREENPRENAKAREQRMQRQEKIGKDGEERRREDAPGRIQLL